LRTALNMKQLRITILLIAASVLLCACPNKTGQDFIYMVNKSDKKIAFQALTNTQSAAFYCSDVGRTIFFEIESNSTFKFAAGDVHSTWDNFLNSLTVFILDGELYDEYWQQPCDTIRKYVPNFASLSINIGRFTKNELDSDIPAGRLRALTDNQSPKKNFFGLWLF